mmetsp:Transcript_19870/g.55381  ORF Transcript_19870/g.55381 Transcript_19870/m.55381 type:complete len:111 (-) Transcript_19870:436-768(-)
MGVVRAVPPNRKQEERSTPVVVVAISWLTLHFTSLASYMFLVLKNSAARVILVPRREYIFREEAASSKSRHYYYSEASTSSSKKCSMLQAVEGIQAAGLTQSLTNPSSWL